MIRLDALPELTTAIDALTAAAAPQGITFTTADFGGFRTQADTTEILDDRTADYAVYVARAQAAGTTPVSINQFRPIAPYSKSFHDYGAARDLKITAKPSTLSTAQALGALGAIAPSVGLRWGGTFTHADPVHFELAIPLSQAAAMWAAYTGSSSSTPTTSSSSDTSSSSPPSGGTSTALAVLLVGLLTGGVLLIRRRMAGM
jgi:D-alanyl-D-alanine carboxypeptidase